MTFDDDFIQFDVGSKLVRLKLVDIGYDWPPPERIVVSGYALKQERRSQLTDAQREKLTNVCRGAEYRVVMRGH